MGSKIPVYYLTVGGTRSMNGRRSRNSEECKLSGSLATSHIPATPAMAAVSAESGSPCASSGSRCAFKIESRLHETALIAKVGSYAVITNIREDTMGSDPRLKLEIASEVLHMKPNCKQLQGLWDSQWVIVSHGLSEVTHTFERGENGSDKTASFSGLGWRHETSCPPLNALWNRFHLHRKTPEALTALNIHLWHDKRS